MKTNERIRVGNRITIYQRGKKKIYVADYWSGGQHCRQSLETANLKVARERAIKLEAELSNGQLAEKI